MPDNAGIAKLCGLSCEEMIAKYGQPGQTDLSVIAGDMGKDVSIFDTYLNSDDSGRPEGNSSNKNNDDQILSLLGVTKEEMEAKYGKPGETPLDEIAEAFNVSLSELEELSGAQEKTKDTSSTDKTKQSENKNNDNDAKKLDEIAEKIASDKGIDVDDVSVVVKALAEMSKGSEIDTKTLADKLGVSEEIVKAVVKAFDEYQKK